MLLNIEKHGGDSGNSVYMNAKLWEGEWVSLYMGLMKKYAEQTNRLSGVANATQFQGVQIGKRRILDARPVGFAEFSTNANLKYIRGEKVQMTSSSLLLICLRSFTKTGNKD